MSLAPLTLPPLSFTGTGTLQDSLQRNFNALLAFVNTLATGGSATGEVPAGGATNFVLQKASGTDYDYAWQAGTFGAITVTTVNKVSITQPTTGATLTLADGKTLTASNTLTFSGTDGSTLNVGTGGTLNTAAYVADSTLVHLAGAEAITGIKTFSSGQIIGTGAGNAQLLINSGATNSAYVNFERGGVSKWDIGPGIIANDDDFVFYPATGGSAMLRITQAGVVTPLSKLVAGAAITLKSYTVATLPAASVGDTAFVTDANATIILGLGLAAVGGGANKVPVYYDGAWKIG